MFEIQISALAIVLIGTYWEIIREDYTWSGELDGFGIFRHTVKNPGDDQSNFLLDRCMSIIRESPGAVGI